MSKLKFERFMHELTYNRFGGVFQGKKKKKRLKKK